jgi:ATP diphosphatase
MSKPLERLLAIMDRLRDPQTGCPWDLEQSFATIVPHTIEEAYEVAEAIEHGDLDDLKGELGDLLFQIVFYARLAKEKGLWDFDQVAQAIADKMIERHPNVFASDKVDTAGAQTLAWEARKAKERAEKQGATSALDGVAVTLPALTRAMKLQKRAARIGFDWPAPLPVIDKIEEEAKELRDALARGAQDDVADELGDLLFTVVNLARKLDVDPEMALRAASRKFERRFRAVEASGATSPDAMERAWDRAKSEES